jgi:hypothetical protein
MNRKWTFRSTAIVVVAAALVIAVLVGVVIDSGHTTSRVAGPPPVSATANSSTTTSPSTPRVKVPNLVGLSQAQIGEILAPGGLTVTKITLVSSTIWLSRASYNVWAS